MITQRKKQKRYPKLVQFKTSKHGYRSMSLLLGHLTLKKKNKNRIEVLNQIKYNLKN
jgi:predicted CopG family antitoxin